MRFTMENHRISSPYFITAFHFRTSWKMCILKGPQLPHRPGPVCQTQKVAPEVAETWHRGGVEFIGVCDQSCFWCISMYMYTYFTCVIISK